MIYDRVLSSGDRAVVEAYLANKYSLPGRVPATPTNVAVTAISSTQTSITWQGEPSTGLGVSYLIKRSAGGSPYVAVGNVFESYSFIDSGLTGGISYSYTVTALVQGGPPSGTSDAATVVTPIGASELAVTGLRLWLKADSQVETDANGKVIQWWDQSPNESDAQAIAAGSRPTLVPNVTNSRPVVRFTGNSEHFSLPNFMAGAVAGEVFVVLRAGDVAPGATNGLWQIGSATGTAYPDGTGKVQDGFGSSQLYQTGTPPAPLTSFQVYNANSQNGTWTSALSGNAYFTSTGNTVGFTSSPVLGGNGAGAWFNGDVAEMIVYDHALTFSERLVVNSYLAEKYVTPPAIWAYASDPNGDADGDGVLNYKDAQPGNAAVGQLQITITTPLNGATVP
jgi:hypothetical protein